MEREMRKARPNNYKNPNKLKIVASGELEEAEYYRIHYWIKRVHGKASYCSSETCKKKCIRYEWALIKGHKYSYDINDYMQLCTSCHRAYDATEEHSARTRERLKNYIPYNKKPILQFTLSNEFVAEFESVAEAARQTGSDRTSILRVTSGKRITAGGYFWKYKATM